MELKLPTQHGDTLTKSNEYGGHWRQGCEELADEELINQSTSLYYETTTLNLGPQLLSTPQRTCRYFEASKRPSLKWHGTLERA